MWAAKAEPGEPASTRLTARLPNASLEGEAMPRFQSMLKSPITLRRLASNPSTVKGPLPLALKSSQSADWQEIAGRSGPMDAASPQ